MRRAACAALRNHDSLTPSENQAAGLWTTLATCLAFTWLNPHVYLDTVVLLGSISSQYEGQKIAFALGAISASFLFFFTGLWRAPAAAALRATEGLAGAGPAGGRGDVLYRPGTAYLNLDRTHAAQYDEILRVL